jgi:hypothetical protein
MSIGRVRGVVVLLVVCGLAAPCDAEMTPGTARVDGPSTPLGAGRVGLLDSATRIVARSGVRPERVVSQQAQRPRDNRRSVTRVVLGAAAGAAGGFFAGGYIGAAIDGDCGGCDDPGFKGFLIGAPIGAVAGGIAGGRWLF